MLGYGTAGVAAGQGEGASYSQGVHRPQHELRQGRDRGLFPFEPPCRATETRIVEREHLVAFG